MKDRRPIFVTGTDTNVGKTVACALLCKALDAGYWKPVQSGTIDDYDRETVASLTALPANYFYPETYALREPLSPHAAAELESIEIDLDSIKLPDFSQDTLIVEGAGGALVPLNQDALIVDLIAHLDIPTIVVARSTLGTINHTLLTLEALRKRNIDVLGVILNGPPNAGNAKAIEFYGDTKVLFHIPVIENDFAKHLSDLASLYTNENRRTTASGAAR